MPLFNFSCSSCGTSFENLMSYNASNPCCPSCGGSTNRQFGLPAIRGQMSIGRDLAVKSLRHDRGACPCCKVGSTHSHM